MPHPKMIPNGSGPKSRIGDAALVERRRAEIVEAATRLIARQGFAKTVVRDIAEEADISVGLIYEYVRAKEDILFLIFEHWDAVWLDGLNKAMRREGDPLDRLLAAVTFLVKMANRHPEVTYLFYRELGNLSEAGLDLARSAEREQVARLAGLIDEAVAEGLLRPDTDATAVATALVLLAHGWVLKGYLLGETHTPMTYAATVVDGAIRAWATEVGGAGWEGRQAAVSGQPV